MTTAECPFEETVRDAVRHPELSPELGRHLETCRPCRESYRVASWLDSAASGTFSNRNLPHPSQIWWRAEIIRRMTARDEVMERVSRPALWGSGLALGTLLAAFTVALTILPPAGVAGAAGPGWLMAAGLAIAPLAALTAFALIWKAS